MCVCVYVCVCAKDLCMNMTSLFNCSDSQYKEEMMAREDDKVKEETTDNEDEVQEEDKKQEDS